MRRIVLGLAILGGLLVVACSTESPQPTPTTTVVVRKAVLPPTDTPVSASVLLPQPTSTGLPVPAARATPLAVPTSTPVPMVVGKTNGDGIWLRATAPTGDKLKAWPDGTNLIVVGPDQSAGGQIWKKVQDPDGTIGWVAGAYLITQAELTPTPPPAAATATKAPSG